MWLGLLIQVTEKKTIHDRKPWHKLRTYCWHWQDMMMSSMDFSLMMRRENHSVKVRTSPSAWVGLVIAIGFFLAMICASVNTWFKLDDLGLPGYNMVKHIFQNSLQSLAYHSKSFPSI
jgi:hypothetical protein